MTKDDLLFQDFLLSYLEFAYFPNLLFWKNRNEGIFGIKWINMKSRLSKEEDFVLFIEWDKKKGHYDPKNPKYFTGAKDRFRSNLYKMITDKKLKLEKKGNTNTNECRFYRIIDQELLNSVSISNATALDQNLTTKIITEQRNVSVASPSVLNQNEEICISSDSVLIIIMQESVVDTVPSEPDVDVSEEFMSQYKTGTGKDSQNKNTISKEEVNFEQVQTIVMDHQSPNQDCGLGKDITEKNYTTQSKEFEELDLICNTLDYRDLFSEVEENFVNYLNNPSILEPSQVKNKPVLENQLDFNVLGPDTESLYMMQPSASSEPEMIDNNYFRGIDFLEDSANFEDLMEIINEELAIEDDELNRA